MFVKFCFHGMSLRQADVDCGPLLPKLKAKRKKLLKNVNNIFALTVKSDIISYIRIYLPFLLIHLLIHLNISFTKNNVLYCVFFTYLFTYYLCIILPFHFPPHVISPPTLNKLIYSCLFFL